MKTITTRQQYRAVLREWAARTRSEPLDEWRGPGTYEPSGFLSDEGRPVATLEYRVANFQPTTTNQNH